MKTTNLCGHHLMGRSGDPSSFKPGCPLCKEWANRVEATDDARERADFARRTQ